MEIFSWAIPLKMRYFRAKLQEQVLRYHNCTKRTSATISGAFKKSQNLKFIPDKHKLMKKLYFLHKNNSFQDLNIDFK